MDGPGVPFLRYSVMNFTRSPLKNRAGLTQKVEGERGAKNCLANSSLRPRWNVFSLMSTEQRQRDVVCVADLDEMGFRARWVVLTHGLILDWTPREDPRNPGSIALRLFNALFGPWVRELQAGQIMLKPI